MDIKTRFAPSPTGYLHIGGVRTALYSWLFARHYNGKFILRIEDTDTQRSNIESITTIIEGMKWLNLNWDEGPYYQSTRLNLYELVINKMLKTGTAYKCYCSKERLIALRKKQIIQGIKPRYDGFCRYNNKNNISYDQPYVVRFRNPKEGHVTFNDLIRGNIEFNNSELDDLVIRRTDGSPTYNFCVVVDDWDMGITHVIRGEDHINNTPRQINILRAIGGYIPQYAHLSMILGENGKKFSKRYDAVNLMEYRKEGYLPEAILNYLLRMGWSYGNQEIFSLKEMVEKFSLDSVSKSPSIFNSDKLKWLNHYYINTLPPKYVAKNLKYCIDQQNINIDSGPALTKLISILGDRSKTLIELVAACRYFYEDFHELDASLKKYLSLEAYKPLKLIHDKLASIEQDKWTASNIDCEIQKALDELHIHMRDVGMPLRVAITGTNKSPSLPITLEAIGQIRSISRLNKALLYISESTNSCII